MVYNLDNKESTFNVALVNDQNMADKDNYVGEVDIDQTNNLVFLVVRSMDDLASFDMSFEQFGSYI